VSWLPGFDPEARPAPGSTVLAIGEGRVIVTTAGNADGAGLLHVGVLDGEPVFATPLAGPPADAPTLRALLAESPPGLAHAAGRAAQLLEWDAGHRFCGRCGAATGAAAEELVRVCPRCGASWYPRIAPAVIMVVERGEEVLLARRAGVTRPTYSCLAGFVEPGETLEEAVVREVREEAGVEVSDVRYAGSQPWPFPSQLMVGFTAGYAGGEIRIDERELAEARWFRRDALPRIPPPFTIAHRLIVGA
jgi:NAD+ diphosphatase